VRGARHAVTAVVAALALTACASGGSFTVGETVAVEGTVTALDASPMFVDRDGLVIVNSPTRGVVTIRVPTRAAGCVARGLSVIHVLQRGDRVRAVGTLVEAGVLRACEDESHLLERLDQDG
jgi:hypothetical protein